MKRFLVTTALKSTIKEDEPILYLGEWCLPKIESSDKIAEYYITERKTLFKENNFLNTFSERVLIDVSKNLNKYHNIERPVRYWRIILGPWLNIFIQILYERWNQIKFVENKYSLTGVYTYEGIEEKFIPNDHSNFNDLLSTDEWNFFIYSKIIKISTKIFSINKKINFTNTKSKTPLRSKLKSLFFEILQIFNRKKKIVLLDYSLSLKRYLLLYFCYGYANRLPIYSTTKTKVDLKKRKFDFNKPKSEFENLVYNLIPCQIPKIYLEDFKICLNLIKSSNLPSNPKKIITSYIHFNEYIKMYVAEKTIKGAKLIISQHGGGYGSYKWLFNQYHELKISNNFLSWGWTHSNSKVIPMGMMKRNDFKNRKSNNQNYFSLILNSMPRYSYKNGSEPQTKFFKEYINNQVDFIKTFDNKLKKKLIIKTYSKDYGWGIEKKLKSIFPKLNISSNFKLNDISKKSRIVVSTFNSTTLLETISSNIPTVFFWNPDFHELSDFAKIEYDKLHRVKVFHKDPISAAKHITNIWEDVDSWWNSKNVRQAVMSFYSMFCYSKNEKKRILADVKKIHNFLIN